MFHDLEQETVNLPKTTVVVKAACAAYAIRFMAAAPTAAPPLFIQLEKEAPDPGNPALDKNEQQASSPRKTWTQSE